MARPKSARYWLGKMHARGRSYAEIGRATGHSADFIQKVAHGDKKGVTLTPTVKKLAQTDARRTTGTAKPLPDVRATTPRREQKVRRPQKHVAPGAGGGETAFYVGKKPGQQILQRIQAAARTGKIVRLTITWKEATSYGARQTFRNHAIDVWRGGGIDAMQATAELYEAGYAEHPEAALAIITTEQIQWESVKGAIAWQLVINDPNTDVWT